MKLWIWVLAVPFCAQAADDVLSRGAVVFRQSCAVAYCHGPEGKAGRAPALAGRHFDAGTVMGIAAMGIPNTSMPAFREQLKPDDLAAVAAYVVSLNANHAEEAATVASRAMPPEVERGRSLFFDPGRPGACGSCHEIDGRGTPVSIALQEIRTARLGNLRTIESPNVVTVRTSGEQPFPAVVVEKSAGRTRVYDLSSRLPVLRTFEPPEVVLEPGSSWSHQAATGLYTEAELAAVSRYLEWLVRR